MVCPYCGTRNIPGSVVCGHCGAILRGDAAVRKVARAPVKQSTLLRIAFVGVAAIVGGAVGGYLARQVDYPPLVGAAPGVVLAALLMYVVSSARILFFTNYYRGKQAVLQSRIRGAISQAEDRYEKQAKTSDGSPEPRLRLATAHLLQDEIEKSVQGFQQAQKQGAAGPEFYNNAGVALARRGNFSQSVDMFGRAAQSAAGSNGLAVLPRANLAHAFARLSGGGKSDSILQALREAQAALGLDGKNATLHNRLGLLLCAAGRADDALKEFGQARELAAGKPSAEADAHNNLGIAHALRGDIGAAGKEFAAALRLYPGHGRALCNQSLMLLRQGETDTALERLQRATRLDPKSAIVHGCYGYALSRVGAINEGLGELKQASTLDGGLFEPLYDQGKIYTDEKIMDVAERYLARALQINARSWEALTAMGVIKLSLAQYPQAIQLFQAADQSFPNQIAILCGLGVSHALSGDDAEAERCFQRAAEADSSNPEVNLHLGWLYLRQGAVSQGLSELQIALEANDKLAVGHNNVGLCQMELNSGPEALQHFLRALQLDPSLGQVHYQLGCAYAVLGQLNDALKEWEQTAKIETTNPDCFSNLGVAFYKKGDLERAVTEFRRVINLRTNRLEDFSNLGLAYAKQGMALRAGSKKTGDAKDKEAQDKQKIAIDMFDRAIAMLPSNAMLHSNRGLACFFANRAEDAMTEWGLVSRLDPNYARRREKNLKSEFDDSNVDYVPLDPIARAMAVPVKTPDYLFQYAPGYDTDEWDLMIDDPALAPVPQLIQESRQLERTQNAL